MESHLLTNAEYPLTLNIKGEDKEFLAVPFSDQDYDALDLWIQSQVISIMRNSLRFGLQEAEESEDKEQIALAQVLYEDEMQIATRAAIGVSIYESTGSSILNTPKGCARILWMMCREKQKDLKFIECITYCRNQENQNEIMRGFAKLNPNESETKDKDVKVEVKDESKNE